MTAHALPVHDRQDFDDARWDERLRIAWRISDESTTYLTELRNGALNQRLVAAPPEGVTAFTLTSRSLTGIITGTVDLAAALADGTVAVKGDPGVLARLVELLAPVDPDFAIVTP